MSNDIAKQTQLAEANCCLFHKSILAVFIIALNMYIIALNMYIMCNDVQHPCKLVQLQLTLERE